MGIARSVADVLRMAPTSGAYRIRFVGPPEAPLENPWEEWHLNGERRLWVAPIPFAGHTNGVYDEGMIDHEIVGPIAEPD